MTQFDAKKLSQLLVNDTRFGALICPTTSVEVSGKCGVSQNTLEGKDKEVGIQSPRSYVPGETIAFQDFRGRQEWRIVLINPLDFGPLDTERDSGLQRAAGRNPDQNRKFRFLLLDALNLAIKSWNESLAEHKVEIRQLQSKSPTPGVYQISYYGRNKNNPNLLGVKPQDSWEIKIFEPIFQKAREDSACSLVGLENCFSTEEKLHDRQRKIVAKLIMHELGHIALNDVRVKSFFNAPKALMSTYYESMLPLPSPTEAADFARGIWSATVGGRFVAGNDFRIASQE